MKYALPILLIVPMTTLTVHELILQPHLNPSNTSCDVIIPFNAQALIYFEASTAMGYGLCGVSSLYFTNVPPGAFFSLSYRQTSRKCSFFALFFPKETT